LVCVASQPSVVPWYPLPAGHVGAGGGVMAGMPGLAVAQPNPSAAPLPVQFALVHEKSFCPTTTTHFPLLHCVSFVQKQGRPEPLQAPLAALQPPTRQP
jgi:hypothetical protein